MTIIPCTHCTSGRCRCPDCRDIRPENPNVFDAGECKACGGTMKVEIDDLGVCEHCGGNTVCNCSDCRVHQVIYDPGKCFNCNGKGVVFGAAADGSILCPHCKGDRVCRCSKCAIRVEQPAFDAGYCRKCGGSGRK